MTATRLMTINEIGFGTRRAQSGAALLIVMLVVVVAASAVLLTKLNRGAARAS